MNCHQLVFVYRNRPYGANRASVGMDLMLTAGTFDQEVTAVFTDEGIFHLLKDQDSEGIGLKNLSQALPAFELYDIKTVLVAQHALDRYSIKAESLVIPVDVVEDSAITSLMLQADQVFVY